MRSRTGLLQGYAVAVFGTAAIGLSVLIGPARPESSLVDTSENPTVEGATPTQGSEAEQPTSASGPSINDDADSEAVNQQQEPQQTRLPAGQPIGVSVPVVEIEVELDPLGLDDAGALEVPDDFSRGGWFESGPKPGQIGPAVITAHVDSLDGPAPFFRLQEMAVGDEIEVLYSGGEVVMFVATRVEQHPKTEFPTIEVYGNTEVPELRLVTCGGDFDRSERSYRHNIIVWAELVTR